MQEGLQNNIRLNFAISKFNELGYGSINLHLILSNCRNLEQDLNVENSPKIPFRFFKRK